MSKVLKRVAATWPPPDTLPIPVPAVDDHYRASAEQASGDVDHAVKADMEAELLRLSHELAEAARQRDELVSSAQQEAERILESARTEAEQVKAAARQSGYAEGLRTGREEAKVELAIWKREETARLAAICEDIERQREGQLRQAEDALRRFAVAAVERLLHRELTAAPAEVGAIVSEVLAELIGSTSVQVRVHPDDYAAARQSHPRWLAERHGEYEITVVPDANLAVGDCVIVGDAARVDARIATRLAELQRSLDDFSRQWEDGSRGESS